MDEIEKITKELPSETNESKNNSDRRKGFIGLELGANIPVGKFADENDGLAKTGFQINLINFGYLFSDNIGITATWFGASNPIEGADSDVLWSHGGLLVGPLFSFPVSEKVEWDVKPMIGLSWATITNVDLESATSIAFNIGSGFRFNVSRLITLTLGVDYTTAKFNWDIGDQTMGALAIKGGFAFRLK
jgi:opacity protein-like surface antigen